MNEKNPACITKIAKPELIVNLKSLANTLKALILSMFALQTGTENNRLRPSIPVQKLSFTAQRSNWRL